MVSVRSTPCQLADLTLRELEGRCAIPLIVHDALAIDNLRHRLKGQKAQVVGAATEGFGNDPIRRSPPFVPQAFNAPSVPLLLSCGEAMTSSSADIPCASVVGRSAGMRLHPVVASLSIPVTTI